MLAAKVIQSVANGVIFQKEEYMIVFNDMIKNHTGPLEDFLEKISVNSLIKTLVNFLLRTLLLVLQR